MAWYLDKHRDNITFIYNKDFSHYIENWECFSLTPLLICKVVYTMLSFVRRGFEMILVPVQKVLSNVDRIQCSKISSLSQQDTEHNSWHPKMKDFVMKARTFR